MIANTIVLLLALAGAVCLLIWLALLVVGAPDLALAFARGGAYLIIPILTVRAMRWLDKLER